MSESKEHLREEAYCPSCGRFIGPRVKCPYCGASSTRRIKINIFRYTAVIMSVVGLVVLVFAAQYETPISKIGDISETWNYAHVRFVGNVTSYPSFSEEYGSIYIYINDGTGETRITVYDPLSYQLIEEGKIPSLYDEVDVEGTMRVRVDFQYLILDISDYLRIKKSGFREVSLSDITNAMVGVKVNTTGEVTDGPVDLGPGIAIWISDGGPEIEVWIPGDLITLTGNMTKTGIPISDIKTGDTIRVIGGVELYIETLEIIPDNSTAIEVLG